MPRAVVTALPSRRVVATIGAETFEATLGAYGGRTFLGLRKALLTSLGLGAGDQVHVELAPAELVADLDPDEEADRAPETAVELDEALAGDPAFARAWARLPGEHRLEYGRWVAAGAVEATRRTRIERLRHRLVRPSEPA